jgi:hypothetical protein
VCGLLAVVLLAACAQIPASGTPEGANVAPLPDRPGGDPVVRVFAEGPHPGDSVYSIVAGFLEASGAVQDGLRTAREYLTQGAATRWRPDSGVTVYDHTQERISARAPDHLEFTAPSAGSVDDQGVFLDTAPGRSVVAEFGLVQDEGNWRIDTLPDGLFVSLQDFDREYADLDLQFLALGRQSPVLVPDPIHLRRDSDLPTALATALLRGPSRWLAPVVTSAVPTGAALDGPVQIASGQAVVHLTPASVPSAAADRDNLLAQLVMTLTSDKDINSVDISAGGKPLLLGGHGNSDLVATDVARWSPADLRPPEPSAYYLRDGVSYLVGAPGKQGPFSAGTALAEMAVAPGGGTLAGISKDRKTVWTSSGETPERLTAALSGSDLQSLTFDQDGNLWVLDGTGPTRALRRVEPNGQTTTATTDGFLPSQILRMRVSSDGVRMALVLDAADGPEVLVGLITADAAGVGVGSLRRLGYGLGDVTDVGWSEPDGLTVLAAEHNTAPQPFSVDLGGVAAESGPSLADVTALAVAPGQPMIATTSKKQVYRLRSGGGWLPIGTGAFATYPG